MNICNQDLVWCLNDRIKKADESDPIGFMIRKVTP